MKPTKETKGQRKAWRTGGLSFILALLIREFGKAKVKEEFDNLPSEKDYELANLFK